jgi:hypothetical protein
LFINLFGKLEDTLCCACHFDIICRLDANEHKNNCPKAKTKRQSLVHASPRKHLLPEVPSAPVAKSLSPPVVLVCHSFWRNNQSLPSCRFFALMSPPQDHFAHFGNSQLKLWWTWIPDDIGEESCILHEEDIQLMPNMPVLFPQLCGVQCTWIKQTSCKKLLFFKITRFPFPNHHAFICNSTSGCPTVCHESGWWTQLCFDLASITCMIPACFSNKGQTHTKHVISLPLNDGQCCKGVQQVVEAFG